MIFHFKSLQANLRDGKGGIFMVRSRRHLAPSYATEQVSRLQARRARNSLVPLRRSSASWMPARMGRLSAGVERRHPVTIRKASLMAKSMRRVWVCEHCGTRQDRSTLLLNTRAKLAVRNVVVRAPQPEPASGLKSATRDVNFLRSNSRCRLSNGQGRREVVAPPSLDVGAPNIQYIAFNTY